MVTKIERWYAELFIEKGVKTFMNGRGLKGKERQDRKLFKGTHIRAF